MGSKARKYLLLCRIVYFMVYSFDNISSFMFIGCCKIKPQIQSIRSKKKMDDADNNIDALMDELYEYLPQILDIGEWEMSFKLTECFSVFKVHLEELLLNQLKNSNKHRSVPLRSKRLKNPKNKKGKMVR